MLGGNLPDSGIFQNTRGLSEGVPRVTQRGIGLKHNPWKCSFETQTQSLAGNTVM